MIKFSFLVHAIELCEDIDRTAVEDGQTKRSDTTKGQVLPTASEYIHQCLSINAKRFATKLDMSVLELT